MKRITLVVALAMVLALVFAAPAFGWAVTPEDGAYLFPFDNTWYDVAGGDIVAIYDASVPIPAGTSVWVTSGWITYTRGLAQSIPQCLFYKLSIGGEPVVPTFAAGKLIWSKVYAEDLSDIYPAFNPRIGAKMFARDWWAPLGVPDAGACSGVLTEKFAHTTTDLSGRLLRRPVPPVHDQEPGITDYEFSFIIG